VTVAVPEGSTVIIQELGMPSMASVKTETSDGHLTSQVIRGGDVIDSSGEAVVYYTEAG